MEEPKNIILFVGINKVTLPALAEFKAAHPEYRLAAAVRPRDTVQEEPESKAVFDKIIKVDFESDSSIAKSLLPWRPYIVGINTRLESRMGDLRRIVPYFPDLKVPSKEAITWTTNKVLMRKRTSEIYPEIAPKWMVVRDAKKKTIKEIAERVGYPLIIKPAGAASSLLVSVNYHPEELTKNLRTALKKIKSLYKERGNSDEPELLLEQFIEGEMYSVDAFVTTGGKIRFCPFVHVKTGKTIGFDDFFGYRQLTPTRLNDQSIIDAEETCRKAVNALALRHTAVHVELFKTEDGWKIIEVNPRLGGFRDDMYRLSFGINLTGNDIFTHVDEGKIKIPKKIKGYTAAMKFYGQKEGKIKSITGLKKLQELESFHSIAINKKAGERNSFAKNGGKSVFNIIFHNADRSKLLADIRRAEQTVKIVV